MYLSSFSHLKGNGILCKRTDIKPHQQFKPGGCRVLSSGSWSDLGLDKACGSAATARLPRSMGARFPPSLGVSDSVLTGAIQPEDVPNEPGITLLRFWGFLPRSQEESQLLRTPERPKCKCIVGLLFMFHRHYCERFFQETTLDTNQLRHQKGSYINLRTLCVKLSPEAHCPQPWVRQNAENLRATTGVRAEQMASDGLALPVGEKGSQMTCQPCGLRKSHALIFPLALCFTFVL